MGVWKKGPRYQGIKKTARARELRKNMTDAEKCLWYLLKNRQLMDFKFRRQVPFENYILDFYSPSSKIVVEVDGGQHYSDEGQKYDRERNRCLSSHGIKVLRYSNMDVLKQSDSVIDDILMHINQSSPSSSPC